MIEVLKQALDAMKAAKELADKYGDEELFYGFDYVLKNINEAMKELDGQEPVAHVYLFDHDGKPRVGWDNAKNIKIGDKLYTHPPQRTEPMSWEDTVLHQKKLLDEMEALLTKTSAPQRTWVGLTDEEVEKLDCVQALWQDEGECEIHGVKEFYHNIEAKLKEKNT